MLKNSESKKKLVNNNVTRHDVPRHCEERSDEAIHLIDCRVGLRPPRNDGNSGTLQSLLSDNHFTHSTHLTHFRKAAFTLAEVLITLAVIGIVAAMTIPVVINKINHIVLKNQFKEMYSTLSTALLKTSYDMNFNTDCYYISVGGVLSNGCANFYKEYFTKNLKIIKICDGNGFNDGCLPDYNWSVGSGCSAFNSSRIKSDSFVAVLNNGSLFFSYGKLPGMPIIGFDVNGKKGPNKAGEDVFAISLVKIENGTVRLGQSLSGRTSITECLHGKLYLDEMMK